MVSNGIAILSVSFTYHGIVFRWLIFGTKSEGLSGNTIPHSQHLFHFVSCNYLFNCTIFQFNPHCATNVLRCYKVESTFFGLVTQLDQTRASLLTGVITLDILEGFSVANFIIFGVLCNILANHLPECSTKPHLGLAPLEITLSLIFGLFSSIKSYQIPSFITLKYKSSDLLTLKKNDSSELTESKFRVHTSFNTTSLQKKRSLCGQLRFV